MLHSPLCPSLPSCQSQRPPVLPVSRTAALARTLHPPSGASPGATKSWGCPALSHPLPSLSLSSNKGTGAGALVSVSVPGAALGQVGAGLGPHFHGCGRGKAPWNTCVPLSCPFTPGLGQSGWKEHSGKGPRGAGEQQLNMSPRWPRRSRASWPVSAWGGSQTREGLSPWHG